jgi:hypothetical protein
MFDRYAFDHIQSARGTGYDCLGLAVDQSKLEA